MARLLIVDDNENLAWGVSRLLETEGHVTHVEADGEAGFESARSWQPDLILLDVMLPGTDGFAVLRKLRQSGLDMPVLLLTARAEEADKVLGFRLGADDYVTKPFGLSELVARIQALLRRARVADGAAHGDGADDGAGDGATADGAAADGSGSAPGAGLGSLLLPSTPGVVERFGDVTVNLAARTVERGRRTIDLTPKGFDLLAALLRRNGAVAHRHDLLREIWGYTDGVMTRTLDMHIANLRRLLERNPSSPKHILTVRKVGYRLKR